MVENKLCRQSLCCPSRQTDTERRFLSQPHSGGIASTESAAQAPEQNSTRALVSLEVSLPGGQNWDPNPQITQLFALHCWAPLCIDWVIICLCCFLTYKEVEILLLTTSQILVLPLFLHFRSPIPNHFFYLISSVLGVLCALAWVTSFSVSKTCQRCITIIHYSDEETVPTGCQSLTEPTACPMTSLLIFRTILGRVFYTLYFRDCC